MSGRCVVIVGLLAGVCLWLSADIARADNGGDFADFRALWVSRYEYSTISPAGVQQVVANAASMGITDLIFQVRGSGDAYYDSNFEPRSERLSGTWDPLQTAIDAAHSYGMNVHAWMNVVPIWNRTDLPEDPSHIFYNTDPSFRLYDINGIVEDPADPDSGGYAAANPILPEFHTHINNVVQDIVSNYDVDGIHLDYIRWLGTDNFDTLPHDAYSHQLFNQATGLDASNAANKNAYMDYIRNRITDLVASIDSTMNATDPSVKLSAAVWRDVDTGYNDRLQDYANWLENDYLDIVMPMMYLSEENNMLYPISMDKLMAIETNALIAPGIGLPRYDNPDVAVSQLSSAHVRGANGSTVYSYTSLFENGQVGVDMRNAIVNFIDSTAQPAAIPPVGGTIVSLVDFETDEGTFDKSPTFAGTNYGIISGTADRVTSEAYDGIASQRINIVGDEDGWLLRHVSGSANPAYNVVIDAEGWIGFWLMTETPGLTVQIGLDDPSSADRGSPMEVIADGQWHLYQWDLENPAHWEGWSSGTGLIDGPTLTIDSIFFMGAGNATFYLDAVAYNNDGSLTPAIPGDINGDGFVGLADLDVILTNWNQTVPVGDKSQGDIAGIGDGFVGLSDLDVVLNNWNLGTPPNDSAYIPEPGVFAICLPVLTVISLRRGK